MCFFPPPHTFFLTNGSVFDTRKLFFLLPICPIISALSCFFLARSLDSSSCATFLHHLFTDLGSIPVCPPQMTAPSPSPAPPTTSFWFPMTRPLLKVNILPINLIIELAGGGEEGGFWPLTFSCPALCFFYSSQRLDPTMFGVGKKGPGKDFASLDFPLWPRNLQCFLAGYGTHWTPYTKVPEQPRARWGFSTPICVGVGSFTSPVRCWILVFFFYSPTSRGDWDFWDLTNKIGSDGPSCLESRPNTKSDPFFHCVGGASQDYKYADPQN